MIKKINTTVLPNTYITVSGGLPVAGPACRPSKIHGPLHRIPTAKDSVTSRCKNEKKHKTVFDDLKGVSILERRKVAVVCSISLGVISLLGLVKGNVMKKSFSTGLSKARAYQKPGPVGFSLLSLLDNPPLTTVIQYQCYYFCKVFFQKCWMSLGSCRLCL